MKSELNNNPAFIPSIHSLRGMASLAVFFKHLCMVPFIPNLAIENLFYWGGLGVQIFFVISGFVLPYSLFKSQYTLSMFFSFIGKRLIRLEPPYLVAILLAIGYLAIGSFLPTAIPLREVPTGKEVLLHLGYLIPFFKETQWVNLVFWTLAVEFQYYLILGLVFPMLTIGNNACRWLFYLLFMLPTLFINKGMIFICLPMFLLGTISALRVLGKIGKVEFWFMLILLSCENLYRGNLPILLALLGTISIIHLVPNITNKLFAFFGDISYSLYLTHFATAMALNNLLWPWIPSPFLKVLVFGMSIAVGIGVAYLFYLYIEKPAKRLAQTFEATSFLRRFSTFYK